jgi:Domain of unknown function (DUF1876)
MLAMKQWRVEIMIGEELGRTYAEAWLVTELGDRVVGTGRAFVSPDDSDVPDIGDEVAVARALRELGGQLLAIASADIAAVTRRPANLTR